MSLDLPGADERPLTSVEQLLQEFRRAEKPRAEARLGLEHEKFLYPASGEPVPVAYDGPQGIGALLVALAARTGGKPFREGRDGPVIAVQQTGSTLSLEPGGQLELSGTAASTAREVHAENVSHLAELGEVGARLGLAPIAVGYRPFGTPAEMPWMPKARYQVMRRTLRGELAHDMMLMTSTGQVSIDFESEADCARKMTALARLAPALVAMYANSPLVRGAPSGFASYRSHVWTGVDPARCGFFRAMIDGSFSYRAYTEWALDAPLLFLRRDGAYRTPALDFRTLLAQGFEGAPATEQDWKDHLSTLFPEVRLKQVLEVRSADCVDGPLTGALAAFVRGIAYDAAALDEVEALLPAVSLENHLEKMERARRQGLRDAGLLAEARECVAIAHRGLARLDRNDLPVLEPLEALVAEGRSPAERVLERVRLDRSPGALLSALRVG